MAKLMRRGIKQESLREVLRIETTHCKQQCRRLEALVDKLIPTVEGLAQTLEQWVGDYARGSTSLSTTNRNLRLFKMIHRRDVHPIKKRLIRIIKHL